MYLDYKCYPNTSIGTNIFLILSTLAILDLNNIQKQIDKLYLVVKLDDDIVISRLSEIDRWDDESNYIFKFKDDLDIALTDIFYKEDWFLIYESDLNKLL